MYSTGSRRDDHVYYNVVITNTTPMGQPATYTDIRNDPIVNNIEDYHLSVIKFTIPTSQLPIIQTFPTGTTATNQTTGYSVTLVGTGGTASQQFLTYIPIDNMKQSYIYSYQTVVDMVNVAFLASATAIGATAGNDYPYMAFDSSSQLFSIFFPTVYIVQGVQIWFNTNTSFLFPSFPYQFYNNPTSISFAQNGEYAQLKIQDNKNPNAVSPATSGYTQIIQEFPSTISMYQPRSLRFLCGLVPTKAESLPVAGGNASPNNSNSQPILTDFDLPLSNSIAEIKPFVQYYPKGPYRLIDFSSQGPINRFDLTIYWVDEVGNLYPLYLDPNQSATIKFLFQRKNKK